MNIKLGLNKNSYYCLHFRVHKRLIPYFKKSVVSKSLYTKSYKEAELKASSIYHLYQQILSAYHILSSVQLQQLVNKFIEDNLEQKLLHNSSNSDGSDSAVTLQIAYQRYTKWYKQQGITDKQYLATTNKLTKLILPYFGVNSSAEDITLEAIEEFKEFLTTFPNINLKPYKSMNFNQLIKLESVPSEKVITISTQIKYLKVLRQYFNYLEKSNIISYNPCILLSMPNGAIENRKPFSREDILNLFSIFEELDDRKYIYYSLIYTGMRPSEFWKASIGSENGLYYFDLTDKNLQLKTHSSYRKIPLHQELINMQIESKLSYLQSTFTQAAVSKYFNKTIKPQVSSDRQKIMYSFRHTVATELKIVGIEMDKVSELLLLGHVYDNSNITKEVYADGYTLAQLSEAINSLEFIDYS